MFQVGEKIAYPMYGAGTITAIVEKEVLGEVHQYYDVDLPHNKMTVLVPVENSARIGVRSIITKEELKTVYETLGGEADKMPANWNRRYRANMERLKTGDILDVAAVVRNLVRSNRKKKLSTGEKKLLSTAKQILESELMVTENCTMEEADELVESHI
ncbi:MAG: CarD family transcriptional regulator [Eubacteriales bacterium]|nr:CarD family transcriptional regulator [Eubacteriales bacterium]